MKKSHLAMFLLLLFVLGRQLNAGAERAAAAEFTKGSPDWLVAMFFVEKEFPDKTKFYVGEMREQFSGEPTLGESYPQDINVRWHSFYGDESLMAFAVMLEKAPDHQDWYIYLKRVDGEWRIQCLRSLAAVEVLYEAMKELEGKAILNDDEKADLNQMKLIVSSDQEIMAFFRNHKEDFELLLKEYGASSVKPLVQNALIRKLRLTHVGTEDGIPGTVFLIGGILDNTVGFLYLADSKTAPRPDPSGIIYIEHIEKGWYLIKTT